MNEIKKYVDMMFGEFPKTKKIITLKENILDGMENKYNDLILEGKNHEEALGTIVSQFGNIEELKKAYDVNTCSDNEKKLDVEYLPSDELKKYISFKKLFSTAISCGVSIIIASLVFNDLSETFGPLIFLSCIAIAVGVFIYFGLLNNTYSKIDKGYYTFESVDKFNIEKKYNLFKKTFSIAIASGVILCILAAMSNYFFSDIIRVEEKYEDILLYILAAIAVNLFVRFGIQNGMYKTLTNPREKYKSTQFEKQYGWVTGTIMPLAAMVFVTLGLMYSNWRVIWIIFPVTAILCKLITNFLKRRNEIKQS